jgi:hypothetical protein
MNKFILTLVTLLGLGFSTSAFAQSFECPNLQGKWTGSCVSGAATSSASYEVMGTSCTTFHDQYGPLQLGVLDKTNITIDGSPATEETLFSISKENQLVKFILNIKGENSNGGDPLIYEDTRTFYLQTPNQLIEEATTTSWFKTGAPEKQTETYKCTYTK